MKPAAVALTDFSDRIPPVMVKELRQGLRSPMFVRPFIAMHLLLLGALAVEYGRQRMDASLAGMVLDATVSPFWLVTGLIVGIVMPLRSFGALHEETGAGRSELLLLGGLSRWQVVRGKWLVQLLFCGLALVSLAPYLIVRYFFGGFDVLTNILTLLNVGAMASAMSACLIGVSGYRSITGRSCAALVCTFWILCGTLITQGMISALALEGRTSGSLILGYGALCGFAFLALYSVTGLQLGRMHLKVSLLPWEVGPRSSMMSLLVLLPFILLAGGLVTCGWGTLFVIAIFIVGMLRHDAPWRPRAGTRPVTVTGYDTGWRPLY